MKPLYGGERDGEGYWIAFYRSIKDQEASAHYAKLARAAIQAHGGKFVVRGVPAKVYEQALAQRVVMIASDSGEKAIAHDSPGYQEALKALGDGVEREIGMVEGLSLAVPRTAYPAIPLRAVNASGD